MAEVGDSEPGELIVASVPEDQKPLVCIEYPGKNKDGPWCMNNHVYKHRIE